MDAGFAFAREHKNKEKLHQPRCVRYTSGPTNDVEFAVSSEFAVGSDTEEMKFNPRRTVVIMGDIKAVVFLGGVSPPSANRLWPKFIRIRPISVCCHAAIRRSEHGRHLRFHVDPKVEGPLGEVVGNNGGAIGGSTRESLLTDRWDEAHTAEKGGIIECMADPWKTRWIWHAQTPVVVKWRFDGK